MSYPRRLVNDLSRMIRLIELMLGIFFSQQTPSSNRLQRQAHSTIIVVVVVKVCFSVVIGPID